MRASKAGFVKSAVVLSMLAVPGVSMAGEWFPCGNLGQLSNCQIPNFPNTRYDYGIAYNVQSPIPVVCVTWNVGYRVHNKDPYFVYSDNPASGVSWGGFVFYTGTLAPDDDGCLSGTWRHRYWRLGPNNVISTHDSNGCVNQPLYCRAL
ncbi:hypothetical protein [Melittangium boletus]|uniref:hypothetical protein n=1 Tax=Melittangium boletus TaxID=83453 RepID=UPI0012FE5419|nr:hypothetical protein [Melittangium boletus]